MRTIIVPAAGKATRFGGTLKELLPLNATDTSLKRAIDNAVIGMDADEVILVTSKEKLWEHTNYVSTHIGFHLPIQYVPQVYDRDLLGAILTGISPHNDGGLVMADTVTFVPDLEGATSNLSFGTFWTQEPERFSVIHDGTIITKQKPVSYLGDGQKLEDMVGYKAWGVVMWSKEVAEYWIAKSDRYEHYDDMFRDGMKEFGYTTFELPYYYDLGSFDKYFEYLKETHK
jgi:hypothetical protein